MGRQITTGVLHYVVPKDAIVKKVKDIDYSEYLVSLRRGGGSEVLLLFRGTNDSPFPGQADVEGSLEYKQRGLRLPNGVDGIDARGILLVEGVRKQWRTAGVKAEFAEYRNASADGATYFDAIINSACYQDH